MKLGVAVDSARRAKVRLSFRVTGEVPVREAFAKIHEGLGYKILDTRTKFPDYQLERGGKQIWAEAEYRASDFVRHEHDASGCDLIVCWVDDLPSDFPVKRLALIDYAQEVPLFEPMTREEVAAIPAMRGQLERVFDVLATIESIAEDVWYMSSARVISTPVTSLDWMKKKFIEGKKDPFSCDVLSLNRGWSYGSEVYLTVDLGSMVIGVEGRLYDTVVGKLDGKRVKGILRKVDELGGYQVKYALRGSGGSSGGDESDLIALPKRVDAGSVVSMRFVKGFRLDEILSGDPYDVVGKLHGEMNRLLDMMEEEGLYVKR